MSAPTYDARRHRLLAETRPDRFGTCGPCGVTAHLRCGFGLRFTAEQITKWGVPSMTPDPDWLARLILRGHRQGCRYVDNPANARHLLRELTALLALIDQGESWRDRPSTPIEVIHGSDVRRPGPPLPATTCTTTPRQESSTR